MGTSHPTSLVLCCLFAWGAASPAQGFVGQCQLTELLWGAVDQSGFGRHGVGRHLSPHSSSPRQFP